MLAGIQRAWIVAVLSWQFRKSSIVLVLLLVLPYSVSQAGADDVSRSVNPAELALVDQFGETGGLATGADGLQVAIVVSAKRLRRLKPWEQAIREIDTDVPIVRVADVPRTAPTEYESVAATLRKRLPPDVNVLVDLQGVWAAAYALDVSVPNVLIFDGAGTLMAVHSGMFKKAYTEALQADLTRQPLESSADDSSAAAGP